MSVLLLVPHTDIPVVIGVRVLVLIPVRVPLIRVLPILFIAVMTVMTILLLVPLVIGFSSVTLLVPVHFRPIMLLLLVMLPLAIVLLLKLLMLIVGWFLTVTWLILGLRGFMRLRTLESFMEFLTKIWRIATHRYFPLVCLRATGALSLPLSTLLLCTFQWRALFSTSDTL